MAAARKGSRIMSVTYISEEKGFRYREKYFFMEEVSLNERIPKSGWMHSGILSLLFRCCCSVKYAVRYEVSNNILFAKRLKISGFVICVGLFTAGHLNKFFADILYPCLYIF